MPTPLLLALALASTAALGAPPAAPPAPAAEPCAALEALPGADACDGPLCSPRERVAIACELRDAMDARYVFRSVKPALLAAAGRPGFDTRRHLDACVAGERAIAREEDPLAFYDRMRRCVAAFDDGHLLLSVPKGLPRVALGVGLRLAGGKVRVASRSPALVRWLEAEGGVPDAGALLAPGTEVVAVDGVPVAEALDAIGAHQPASSRAARLERAVDALTARDFAHPRARTARLTVIAAGVARHVELPWWVAPGAERNPLAAAWLRRVGLRTTDLLDWSGAPRWAVSDPAAGASRADTILDAAEARSLLEYRGDGGHLAARLGEGTARDGRRFCYVQLLTFHTEKLVSGDERRPYAAVVEEHVRACAARGEDLVLDLRQNEGGYLSHSTALARLLAPAGAAVPPGALLVRATDQNERVYRERAPSLGTVRTLITGARSDAERVLDAIREARRGGREFTPAFLDPPHRAGEDAFGGAVVVLTSPACMSACDRLAAMLQGAGRAVIVGGPTEGAGASQQEVKGISVRWEDSGGRLVVSIPNAAMGVARGGAPAEGTASAESFFERLALENRPVVPDRRYETSVEDLTGANRGWRAAAEEALGPAAPAEADPVARGAPASPAPGA